MRLFPILAAVCLVALFLVAPSMATEPVPDDGTVEVCFGGKCCGPTCGSAQGGGQGYQPAHPVLYWATAPLRATGQALAGVGARHWVQTPPPTQRPGVAQQAAPGYRYTQPGTPGGAAQAPAPDAGAQAANYGSQYQRNRGGTYAASLTIRDGG